MLADLDSPDLADMDHQGSFRSTSSGGYATPDEEDLDEEQPEQGRSVRFSKHVQEDGHEVEHPEMNDSSRKKNHSYHGFRSPKLGNHCCANFFRRYPRTNACLFGIVIPLFALVALCLFCGYFLGELEAPGELSDNDAAMRRRAVQVAYSNVVSDVVSALPTVCYMLYQNNTDSDDLTSTIESILEEEGSLDNWIDQQPNLTGHKIVNVSKFVVFMEECGKSADDYTATVQEHKFENITVDPTLDKSMAFNWVRCVNRTTNNMNRVFRPTEDEVMEARPSAQEELYSAVWFLNFNALRVKYTEEFLAAHANNSFSEIDSRFHAFNRSLWEATAEDACMVNVAASAWFWFTVMTTVGYGNQAPSSVGGRAMVFTLGFVSILLFGGCLATTGTILSHLVFDFVHRLRLKWLLKKQVMMMIWGALWLIYMFLTSWYLMNWLDYRLDEQIPWQDAYWFSYITTTTVGLGDIYPVPGVLFINDLLIFSLSFLFGFVLLSTFLAELRQLCSQHFPDISLELGKQLYQTGITDAIPALGGERTSFGTSLRQPESFAEVQAEYQDSGLADAT